MLVNSSTDKVFKNDTNREIVETEEELLETSHESPPSSLPSIFSLAANTSKNIEAKRAEDFYEVVELCRAQMNKPHKERYPPIAYAVKIGRSDVVKFFIDHGESVNTATPAVPVWYYSYHRSSVQRAGDDPGYTPLEIAIKQQDVEMVKILTTYNPDNRANVEVSYQRFEKLWLNDSRWGEPRYWGEYFTEDPDNYYLYKVPSSPLLDSLETGNQEIIDLVIKAYTDPKKLYAEYKTIQRFQNEEVMRSWIEQNVFLWTGEQRQVSDSVVKLFMENKQGLPSSPADVEILLQHGWIVTKQELELALITNDSQIVELLIDHPRVQESPFILLAQHHRGDLVTHLIEKGNVPARDHLDIAIKHGALDVVKVLIANDMAFDGALLLAAEHKQKAVVEYLLELPIDKQEIDAARAAAYRVHAYDIMELLEL